MCGGGSDDAAKEAQAAEEARQRQIAETIRTINNLFGGYSGPPETELLAQRADIERRIEQQQQALEAAQAAIPQAGGLIPGTAIPVTPGDDTGAFNPFQAQAAQQRAADIAAGIEQLQAQLSGVDRNLEYAQSSQDRDQAYATHGANVLAKLRRDLDEQRTDTARQVRQALARRSLLGGSANVDANREVLEDYDDALLRATGQSQDAVAAFRQADEEQKQRLIGLAQGGLDAGTAASQSLSAMRANLDAARAQENLAQLGNVFGGVANLYQLGQAQQGQQLADRSNPYGTYYPSRTTYGGKISGY